MSKERAIRRAAREEADRAAREARERTLARRARRVALRRKLIPRLPRRGRVGVLLPRRTPAQRSALLGGYALIMFFIWYGIDDLATRIALTAVVTVALPAVAVLAFGRRSS